MDPGPGPAHGAHDLIQWPFPKPQMHSWNEHPWQRPELLPWFLSLQGKRHSSGERKLKLTIGKFKGKPLKLFPHSCPGQIKKN